jgi:hypothetical protein
VGAGERRLWFSSLFPSGAGRLAGIRRRRGPGTPNRHSPPPTPPTPIPLHPPPLNSQCHPSAFIVLVPHSPHHPIVPVRANANMILLHMRERVR